MTTPVETRETQMAAQGRLKRCRVRKRREGRERKKSVSERISQKRRRKAWRRHAQRPDVKKKRAVMERRYEETVLRRAGILVTFPIQTIHTSLMNNRGIELPPSYCALLRHLSRQTLFLLHPRRTGHHLQLPRLPLLLLQRHHFLVLSRPFLLLQVLRVLLILRPLLLLSLLLPPLYVHLVGRILCCGDLQRLSLPSFLAIHFICISLSVYRACKLQEAFIPSCDGAAIS